MKHLLALALVLTACGDNVDTDPLPDPDPIPDPDPVPPPAPGIRFFDFPIAVDVSPDGKIAAFESITLADGAVVQFHDTITGETVPTAVVGDPTRNLATGISNTGAISAMHGEPVEAGLWTEATDWMDLGSPHAVGCGDAEVAGAFDISADGGVVVGMAWNGCSPDAFRWTEATGFVSLQVLGTGFGGNPPTNRATVVSDDGRIAAGFAENVVDRSPAVWKADGTGFLLDPTNVDEPGEVLSIDADGHTVAGQLGNDGFVWTAGTGIVRLARTPNALGGDPMFPNAMSADGSLVFGGVGSAFFAIPEAFVWSFDAGTRSLAEVVTAAGIELPEGMLLNTVLGASADGSVLIGIAMDIEGFPKSFVLRLPATAYAVR